MFIVGRAITGFGVAGTFVGSYIIIGVSAPEKQRPGLTGLLGSAYAIASIIGPLIGGALTAKVGWRWWYVMQSSGPALARIYINESTSSSFYINLPCGAVAAASIVLFLRIPEAAKPAQATLKEKLLQMDLTGVVTITAGVVCYLLALQWGGFLKRWGSSDVVRTLIGFVILTIAFLVNEWWLGETALLLPSVPRNRTIASGCAFCFL